MESINTLRRKNAKETKEPSLKPNTNWAKLCESHNNALISFLTGILNGNVHEAHDVAQEAYVKMLGLDNSETISHLKSYLFKTARNIAIDRMRSKSRHEFTQNDDWTFDNIIGETPAPPDEVATHQNIEILKKAMAQLPSKRRYIFLRYRLHGVSYQQLSEELNLSESMIRKHVIQAMRFCKTYLAENN